jgi:predicted transcriptional regulator YdeE
MNYQSRNLGPFHIAGISVRTTNQNGQSQEDIGKLWQRFYSENIMDALPARLSDDLYCVYTDYESDHNGAYTTVLGYKVPALESVPAHLTGITIPETTYRLYRSEGKLPESVLATWQHIWQSPVERKYMADFDVYGSALQNPESPVVETYLSVK